MDWLNKLKLQVTGEIEMIEDHSRVVTPFVLTRTTNVWNGRPTWVGDIIMVQIGSGFQTPCVATLFHATHRWVLEISTLYNALLLGDAENLVGEYVGDGQGISLQNTVTVCEYVESANGENSPKPYDTRMLVIPFGGEPALTAVFREKATGNVPHATEGDCSPGITFAQGRAAAVRHPQSGDWLIAIPAARVKTLHGTLYSSVASGVTKDTAPEARNANAFLFDMKSGASFSEMLPMLNGRVLVE